MTSIPLTPHQRSLVEIDLLSSAHCDDEPAFDLAAVSTHYAETGRLLLVPGVVEQLGVIADVDPEHASHQHITSALALWRKARAGS